MKALFLFLFLLFGGRAYAQQEPYRFSPLPLDAKTNKVVYTETLPVAGISQAQLLVRAQDWAAQLVRSTKATALRTAPETATVRMRVTLKNGQEAYNCQVLVTTRDGAYQYVLRQVTFTQPNYARAGKHSSATSATTGIETLVYTRPSKYRNRKLTEIDSLLRRLLIDLNQHMLNPADGLAQKQ